MDVLYLVVGVILHFMVSIANGRSLQLCNTSIAENTCTIKSFRAGKYLKVQWNDDKEAPTLSFTGNENDCGTDFIQTWYQLEGSEGAFTLRPAERSRFILAVEEGSLIVKQLSNPPVDQPESKYLFQFRRISLSYSMGGNHDDTEMYRILNSSTSIRRSMVVKSNKFGNISLGYNWKDCRAWFKFE